jgi:hypothetical protein
VALLIDASSPVIATGTSTTVTTASFTPPAGSLLLIEMSANSIQNFNPVAPTITDNLGSHLVYDLSDWYSEADNAAVSGQCAIWTAEVPTTTSMTVSVTVDPSAVEHAVKVTVLTGHDPSDYLGAHGKASSTSASSIAQSYNGQATSGWGFGVVCDWDALGAETAGSGCTIQSGNVGSGLNYGFVRRTADDDTLGVGNSLNVTLPGNSTNLSWCWLEILPLVVNQDLVDPPPYIFFHPPGQFGPNGIWTPWLGVPDSPYQPLQLAVTATESGTTNNGISLLVRMLTGVDSVQPGVSNSSTSITTPSLSITPGATGSWVYGALTNANSTTTWTALSGTTMQANSADATNGAVYGHYRSTATTTAATPVTLGASAPTGGIHGGLAQVEIRSATGLVEDAGAPALALATTAITVSTTRFTAVAGCVLLAGVCADSGAGVVNITVSGGGLIWTEIAKANASSAGYAGVWMARIPALPATGPQSLTADAADTAAATDAATRAGTATRTTVDTAAAADTAVRDLTEGRTAVDTAAAADTAVRAAQGLTRSVADTAIATDTATRTTTEARTAADTAAATDVAAGAAVKLRTAADTATAADVSTRATQTLNRTAADTAVATDVTARTSPRTRTAADAAVATDAAVGVAGKLRTATDTAAATDTATRGGLALTRTTADSAVATDTATRATTRPRTTADTSIATDVVTRSQPRTRTGSDTAAATDTVARAQTLTRVAADAAVATDSAAGSVSSPGALTRSASDTAAAADAATRAAQAFSRTATDTTVATDVAVRTVGRFRTTSDTSVATDAAVKSLTRVRSATDTAASADVAVRAAQLPARLAADAATAVDSADGINPLLPVNATSAPTVTTRRRSATSVATRFSGPGGVTGRRTSIPAVDGRRTSSPDVSARRTSDPEVAGG